MKGEPPDAERAIYDKIASLTMLRGNSTAYTPLDSAPGVRARGVLAKTFGESPVTIRMMGATVPTDKLVDALEMPFVIIPLVNGDNNHRSGRAFSPRMTSFNVIAPMTDDTPSCADNRCIDARVAGLSPEKWALLARRFPRMRGLSGSAAS